MILLGVTIKAGLKIDMYGVTAWLEFTRIKFLPALMICKDHHCKKEEGPRLKLELKTIPPSFKLEAEVFANVFGFKFKLRRGRRPRAPSFPLPQPSWW